MTTIRFQNCRNVVMQFGDSELVPNYPAHTRVVSRAWQNTCTLGYGISLPGARRLLYEFSVNKMTGPTDMMFFDHCAMDRRIGRSIHA